MPSVLTCATSGLLLSHVIAVFLPPVACAVSFWLAPTACSSMAFLLILTRPISEVTVTVQRSTCPAVVSALMTALPELWPVTVPLLLTCATEGLLLTHCRT